jgi:hypothetical protein
MVIFDAEGSLEIVPLETVPASVQGAGDMRFEITANSGGFSGKNSKVWVARPDLDGWIAQLRWVAADRKGAAELRSMSPGDFLLIVRVADSAGHIAIEGHLSRTLLGARRAHRHNIIEFRIDFDPTRLPELLAQFETMIKAA